MGAESPTKRTQLKRARGSMASCAASQAKECRRATSEKALTEGRKEQFKGTKDKAAGNDIASAALESLPPGVMPPGSPIVKTR